MSRTYRFKKDKWRINYDRVLEDYKWPIGWIAISPSSTEGQKRLAEFHSDAKRHVMCWTGPMWYQRLYAQKPYRNKTKQELYKYKMNPEYEVQLRSKPYIEWYY